MHYWTLTIGGNVQNMKTVPPLSQSACSAAAAESASEPFHPIGNKNTLSLPHFSPFSPLFSRNVACDLLQRLSHAATPMGGRAAKNVTK